MRELFFFDKWLVAKCRRSLSPLYFHFFVCVCLLPANCYPFFFFFDKEPLLEDVRLIENDLSNAERKSVKFTDEWWWNRFHHEKSHTYTHKKKKLISSRLRTYTKVIANMHAKTLRLKCTRKNGWHMCKKQFEKTEKFTTFSHVTNTSETKWNNRCHRPHY